MDDPKRKAYAVCALAYATAIAAAAATAIALEGRHPIFIAAAADIAATVVVFGFSVAFNNSSLYDPYWSLAPIPIAVYWAWPAQGSTVRAAAAVALVSFWGLRLTFNFLRGWRGMNHEDWRYADFRKKCGRAYWFVSFTGIHLVPTLFVFLGCLPLYPALTVPGAGFTLLDVAAVTATAAAIVIETIADKQLGRFVRCAGNGGKTLTSGLWAYSRHPNYFGEILFWWGLFCFAMAADPGAWWTAAGPVSITLLFVFISLPLIEKRHLRRRADYREQTKGISILVPWFPRK